MTLDFKKKTEELIDSLKSTCASFGLGNDGNEFKIIVEAFLYKFLNDKFAYEVKKLDPKLAKAESWEKEIAKYKKNDYEMLLLKLGGDTAKLKPEHFISKLFERQNDPQFANLLDDTLRQIARDNYEIFSVKTGGDNKVVLFEGISHHINNQDKRDGFCRAIIDKLVGFSFENIFEQKFDFFAHIFEYLIKDYNKDGGGKYAEYYTPHAVAKIMASILVDKPVKNKTCYDPSAGSGTLLMNIAHAIGEDRCMIYSQDISQKSSSLLRLNLILNNLVHSIQNIVEENTLTKPFHKNPDNSLMNFDYIVSNPPFKLDFSEDRPNIDTKANYTRFFAGVPKIPKAKVDKMPIYLLFIQHIMASLNKNGKAAIVVPTGFITAQSGIERKIREEIVKRKMLRGVISMPSNIFATTGTSVSILFLDCANTQGDIVLMDSSKLGQATKQGNNQKTLLADSEEDTIIKTFNNLTAIDEFSVVVSYEDIKNKNFSYSAGQYFDVKIDNTKISADEFKTKINSYSDSLNSMFKESKILENQILIQMSKVMI